MTIGKKLPPPVTDTQSTDNSAVPVGNNTPSQLQQSAGTLSPLPIPQPAK
jgi:hypothetical protein